MLYFLDYANYKLTVICWYADNKYWGQGLFVGLRRSAALAQSFTRITLFIKRRFWHQKLPNITLSCNVSDLCFIQCVTKFAWFECSRQNYKQWFSIDLSEICLLENVSVVGSEESACALAEVSVKTNLQWSSA